MNQLLLLILLPAAAAPLAYAFDRVSDNLRKLFSLLVLLAELVLSLLLVLNGDKSHILNGFCGMGLSLTLDGFRGIHIVLASLLWLISGICNLEYAGRLGDKKQGRYELFTLLTLAATMGVFLSADLFTAFTFFEVMSFTSYMWVLHDGKKQSMRASETYLGVSVIAGMVMLMGLFLLYQAAGTLNFTELSGVTEHSSQIYLSGALILVGFGAKAGLYPLHIWMPKAYPAAPSPASALLSGILSKAGIYGMIAVSSTVFFGDKNWGMAILVLGVITMFWGGVQALLSVDFKKTVACSSMSQIGFIAVGIGMQCLLGAENSIAVHGTTLHIVNHSLIKLVLFLLSGVIFVNVKKYALNDIKGFGRGKPFFAFAFLTAALGVAGVPLFNGYISKTLLHESIVEYATISGSPLITAIEWIFLVSGGLTVAYMLKLFVVLFVEKGSGQRSGKRYMSPLSKIAIAIPCILMLLLGTLPHLTADPLAVFGQEFMRGETGHSVAYFSWINLKGACISLTFGALFYLILVRKFMIRKSGNGITLYIDRWPEHFELETMVYRPLIQVIIPELLGLIFGFMDRWVFQISYKFVMIVLDLYAVLMNSLVAIGYKIIMSILNVYAVITGSTIDVITDFVVKHIFTAKHTMNPKKISKPLTYLTGKLLDKIEDLAELLFHKKHKDHAYAEAMQNYEEESALRRKMISASLSYGLLFCGIGLVIVMLYLLLH